MDEASNEEKLASAAGSPEPIVRSQSQSKEMSELQTEPQIISLGKLHSQIFDIDLYCRVEI